MPKLKVKISPLACTDFKRRAELKIKDIRALIAQASVSPAANETLIADAKPLLAELREIARAGNEFISENGVGQGCVWSVDKLYDDLVIDAYSDQMLVNKIDHIETQLGVRNFLASVDDKDPYPKDNPLGRMQFANEVLANGWEALERVLIEAKGKVLPSIGSDDVQGSSAFAKQAELFLALVAEQMRAAESEFANDPVAGEKKVEQAYGKIFTGANGEAIQRAMVVSLNVGDVEAKNKIPVLWERLKSIVMGSMKSAQIAQLKELQKMKNADVQNMYSAVLAYQLLEQNPALPSKVGAGDVGTNGPTIFRAVTDVDQVNETYKFVRGVDITGKSISVFIDGNKQAISFESNKKGLLGFDMPTEPGIFSSAAKVQSYQKAYAACLANLAVRIINQRAKEAAVGEKIKWPRISVYGSKNIVQLGVAVLACMGVEAVDKNNQQFPIDSKERKMADAHNKLPAEKFKVMCENLEPQWHMQPQFQDAYSVLVKAAMMDKELIADMQQGKIPANGAARLGGLQSLVIGPVDDIKKFIMNLGQPAPAVPAASVTMDTLSKQSSPLFRFHAHALISALVQQLNTAVEKQAKGGVNLDGKDIGSLKKQLLAAVRGVYEVEKDIAGKKIAADATDQYKDPSCSWITKHALGGLSAEAKNIVSRDNANSVMLVGMSAGPGEFKRIYAEVRAAFGLEAPAASNQNPQGQARNDGPGNAFQRS